MAEEIKAAVAQIFMRGNLPVEGLFGKSISVTKVILSKDLKDAKIYVMPLAGKDQEEVVRTLNENKSKIRYEFGRRMELKYIPEIRFFLDDTFDEVDRIEQLLKDPNVRKDLD